MIEMSKTLTISSAHITSDTAKKLTNDPDTNCLGLCVYPKADYGWFIMGLNNIETSVAYSEDGPIPKDLATVIDFAKDVGADILCIDCDGPEHTFLPSYDW